MKKTIYKSLYCNENNILLIILFIILTFGLIYSFKFSVISGIFFISLSLWYVGFFKPKYSFSVGILGLSTPMSDDNYHSFFAVTNKFLLIFLPIVILFSFCLYSIIVKIFMKYSTLWYIGIPLLCVSIFFYFFPAIMLIFSILVSGFMLNLTYSSFFEKWLSSKMSSSNLLSYLNEVGILPFFFRLFSSIFCISTANQFMLILWSSHILSFLYVLLSRYYIFFTFVIILPFPKIVFVFVLSAIFVCLVALLFRFFINISLGIVFTTMSINPSLWENFLLTEPLFDPAKNPPNLPSNNNGWFSSYTYNYNYNSNGGYIPPRISAWKVAGYGIGFCTLGVSCFIAYHTYGSHMESRKQTAIAAEAKDIAGEANRLKRYELVKANPKDIDLIFAGFPEEKESYLQRRK